MKANLSSSQLITSMRSHGFALIEFIAVLAIMAIMAGAVAPLLINNIDRSEAEKERLALEAIGEGIRQYYLEHGPNMGRLPQDIYDAGGALTDTWAGLIEGNYVGLMETNILTNSRGNTRGYYYVSSGDFSVIPSLTLYSHIDVDENAPASLDYSGGGSCAGRAGEYVDPCDSATAIDFNLRILNINLGKERQQIIDQVKSRYLAPVAAAFERLPYDVCSAIPDSSANQFYVIDDAAPTAPSQALSTTVRVALQGFLDTAITDPWAQEIRVIKFADNLFIWSGGPFGRNPNNDPLNGGYAEVPWLPPEYPLLISARCHGGESERLNVTFSRIKDAVIGYAAGIYDGATQPYVFLPANIQVAIGYSGADISDPWGTPIEYLPENSVVGAGGLLARGLTLRSWGPDGADDTGGNDDIDFIVTEEEVRGSLADVGIPYPGIEEHLDRVAAVVIGWAMTNIGNGDGTDYWIPGNQAAFNLDIASLTSIVDPAGVNIAYTTVLNGAMPVSFTLTAPGRSDEGNVTVNVSSGELYGVFASAGKSYPIYDSVECGAGPTGAYAILDSAICSSAPGTGVWDNPSSLQTCIDNLKVYMTCPPL